MDEDRSRLQPPPAPPREKLEDRYRKIGLAAVAAAVSVKDKSKEPRQMSAETPHWTQIDAQS
ncbi:hypothetical protein [Labrys wisconsinensis]|uniref:Uncharacterized protein n=1 Tax=Labrys wisconsinensis TaxID=425677 RepID=A0ABU0JAX6_9HYPH|nr:hypothetical protein [Labrys wisconsinensis]MDQ0470686.1 hypothetical protein [Labrys wisconsinensis]